MWTVGVDGTDKLPCCNLNVGYVIPQTRRNHSSNTTITQGEVKFYFSTFPPLINSISTPEFCFIIKPFVIVWFIWMSVIIAKSPFGQVGQVLTAPAVCRPHSTFRYSTQMFIALLLLNALFYTFRYTIDSTITDSMIYLMFLYLSNWQKWLKSVPCFRHKVGLSRIWPLVPPNQVRITASLICLLVPVN